MDRLSRAFTSSSDLLDELVTGGVLCVQRVDRVRVECRFTRVYAQFLLKFKRYCVFYTSPLNHRNKDDKL